MASDAPPTPVTPTPSPEPTPTPSGEPGSLLTNEPPKAPETPPAEPGKETPPVDPNAKPEEKPAESAAFAVDKLTLPDGFDPKDPAFTKFTELATELKIPTDKAQVLLDTYKSAAEGFVTAQQSAWADVNKAWVAELRSDPEIGAKLDTEVLPSISKLINEFGGTTLGPEVRKAMDLTGAGNNPAIVRFLAKVAKALGEGTYVAPGGATGTKPTGPGAQAMYPNLPQG